MPAPTSIRSPQETAHQRVGVIACGKHPGWADQIDAVGRVTPLLGSAKRSVYLTGIATAAQRGVWDRIPTEQRLEGFAHELLWLAPDASGSGMAPGVVGRMWSSRDARGRSGWPMLVLAGVEGAGSGWLVDQVASRLGAVERMCRETSAPELVRLSLGEAARQVEDALAPLIGAPRPEESDATLLARLIETLGREKGAEMIARVTEAIHRGDQHVRVPRVLSGAGRALRAWAAVVRELLPDLRAVLVLDREGTSWIDVVLGNADPLILSCLRADQTHTPLTTSGAEPTLESMRAARARVDGWCAAGVQRAAEPVTPVRSRRGAAVLLVGAAALLVIVTWLLTSRVRERERATIPDGVLVERQPSEATERRIGAPVDTARLMEDTDRLVKGMAELRAELRDQGLAPDDSLSSRAQRVQERIDAGERSAELAREAEAVRREVDALRSEAAGRVLELVREASFNPPAVSEPLREAYAHALSRIAPREGMARARARIDEVAREVREAERIMQEAESRPIKAAAGVDERSLRAAEQSRSRAAREQAALALKREDPTGVEDAANSLRGWRDAVAQSVESAGVATALLDAGTAYDEHAGVPGSTTLRNEAMKLRDLPSDVLASGAFAPVLRRIEELERVSGETEPDALLDGVERLQGRAQSSVANQAWRRLVEIGAPRTREQLRRAERILREGSDSDGAQRGRTDRFGRELWWNFVTQHAKESEDTRAAIETRAGMLHWHTDDKKLPSWLHAATAVDELARAEGEAEIHDAARRFIDASPAWRDVEARQPGLASLREVCERALATENDTGHALEGPASAGWKIVKDDEANPALQDSSITLRSPEGTTVRFERVVYSTPDRGEHEFYLSTCEFSVRELVELTRLQPHLIALLPDHGSGPADSRAGVRTWTRRGARVELPAMNAAKGWQRVSVRAQAGPIAPGLDVPALTLDAPVQSVSPVAALAIARELGCRLPTIEEWRRACQQSPTVSANLRDASFARQARYLRDNGAATGVAPPATDAFRTSASTAASDIEPAMEGDDGSLWFVPVHKSEDAIAHLLGNVAEFVVEDAEPLRETGAERGALEDSLRRAGVHVIGGSAISDRGLDPHVPQPVDLGRASMGYSDVGFRLAFERLPGPRKAELLRNVREAAKTEPLPTPIPRADKDQR